MPIIDAHIHLYPDEVNHDPAGWGAACGETLWATLCTRKRKNGQSVQSFPGVGELLRAMDAAGVERAVLQGWYWEQPETCVMQNRFYAECIGLHPDRLSAFAAIHPGVGVEAALGELWIARDSGMIGVGELSPHSQGVAIDDPVLGAVFSRAGEYGMPVNLHVTDPASRPYPGRVETPLADFMIMANSHPSSTFILAHWGGCLPLISSGTLPENIYYDSAASPLLYPETIWMEFCAMVAADRVFFGSDYPLNLYPSIDREPVMERLVAEAHRSGLSASHLKGIVGDNAKRLFKLS